MCLLLATGRSPGSWSGTVLIVPAVNRLPVDTTDSGKQFTATIYRCGGSAGLASNAHRLPVSFRLLKTAKTPVAFSRYEFKRLTVKLTKFMAGIKTIQTTCIFCLIRCFFRDYLPFSTRNMNTGKMVTRDVILVVKSILSITYRPGTVNLLTFTLYWAALKFEHKLHLICKTP